MIRNISLNLQKQSLQTTGDCINVRLAQCTKVTAGLIRARGVQLHLRQISFSKPMHDCSLQIPERTRQISLPGLSISRVWVVPTTCPALATHERNHCYDVGGELHKRAFVLTEGTHEHSDFISICCLSHCPCSSHCYRQIMASR